MPSLIDIRRRIRSVKNTQQITKAMKMVSAAKLRKAQERAMAARPYGDDAAARCWRTSPKRPARVRTPARHPLLAVRPEKRILVIVVTADRGLAGGFNANLLKLAQRFVGRASAPHELSFELIGRKGRDYFRKRDAQHSRRAYGHVPQGCASRTPRRSPNTMIDAFSNAEVDAVYLFGNEFKSVMAPHLTARRAAADRGSQVARSRSITFTSRSPRNCWAACCRATSSCRFIRALLESVAAEHAARMTAMDAASSNATDVIDKLTLYMNRVRQASITREIIEIVSGAAALD